MFIDPENPETIPAAAPPRRFDVAALEAELAQASPRDIVEAAIRFAPGRMAVVSSFGTESAVLLKFIAEVDPSLPVLFLDTQWLFKETLAYRDALTARLGLTDVRTVTPSPSALALRDP
ncbi:MAG: phosphoadenosine phosphosulfate reductase family protein, partial [Xanthobacteraceae bacterium]